MTLATMPTREAYQKAFETERQHVYPVIDAIEAGYGCAVDGHRLEDAARVLACPVKKNPPNWQHGRLIYAVARRYLLDHSGPITCLDIGTAKGFSALCLQWALNDSGQQGRVYSVDVINPLDRASRNTVAEVGGAKTLAEILEPWPEASAIRFEQNTGYRWLTDHPERVHVAFVDGKHQYEIVRAEIRLICRHQDSGDAVIFDDLQVPGVAQAITEQKGYQITYVDMLPNRRYAIGRKA